MLLSLSLSLSLVFFLAVLSLFCLNPKQQKTTGSLDAVKYASFDCSAPNTEQLFNTAFAAATSPTTYQATSWAVQQSDDTGFR